MAPVSTLAKYKLVFLRDQPIGKTNIITRYMYDKFNNTYQLDRKGSGVSFRAILGIPLWQSLCMTLQSFLNTSKWIEEVRTEQHGDVIIVLVGNKTDLVEKRASCEWLYKQVSIEEGEAKACDLNVMFIETSAKAGFNIKALFRKFAAALPRMETLSSTKQEDMVDVNLKSSNAAAIQSQPQSGGCAC